MQNPTTGIQRQYPESHTGIYKVSGSFRVITLIGVAKNGDLLFTYPLRRDGVIHSVPCCMLSPALPDLRMEYALNHRK